MGSLSLAPKTHPSRQNYLMITQIMCGTATTGEEGVLVGVVKLAPELLSEFDSILCSSAESASLREVTSREWWGVRTKFDKQLKVSPY